VRSCIRRLAFCGSFQSAGSSARLFNSARRSRARSTSKMPPQQDERLLDLIEEFCGFCAHDGRDVMGWTVKSNDRFPGAAQHAVVRC
jgi:hypothetical protein